MSIISRALLLFALLVNPAFADGIFNGGSSGGVPSGAAGGGLAGSYPNPTVATVPASAMPALTGDCTTSAGAVATNCTKTGGVAFAPSATTDATNAANISSGTLPAARLPAATSSTFGGVKPDGTTLTNTAGAISVAYGTAANTAAQGNVALQTGAVTAWTPTDASGGGLTFTVNTAYYYKDTNSKRITIWFDITWPTNSDSHTVTIGGLPAASFGGGFQAGQVIYNSAVSTTTGLQISPNGTVFTPLSISGASPQNAAMTGATMRAQATYVTN